MGNDGNLLLEKGATLILTCICQIESATDKGFRSLPNRISLLLRGPRDIRVLTAAPFWDARRLLIASSSLGAVVLLTFIWIFALRRRVSRLESKIIDQATLEERQRIAREFHDTLEQELAGLSLRLDAATTRPLEEKARSLLETSRNLVSRIQSEARNLVADLRNTEPAPDLVSALKEIRSRMPPNSPDLALEIQSIPCLPPYVSHHLRMIAQETITNSVKHSRANHLKLHLSSDEQQLTLLIQDDGIGFDPSAETNGKPGHFGCMGIRERCRKIGADVEWQSQIDQGSSMIVTLPWSAASLKPKRAV